MSKCQMRKYLPGGRCGGVTESIKKEDTQGVSLQPSVNTSFNSLLAQRDAQMAQLWAPQQTQTQTQQNQLVVVQVKEEKKPSKDHLINTILGSDY